MITRYRSPYCVHMRRIGRVAIVAGTVAIAACNADATDESTNTAAEGALAAIDTVSLSPAAVELAGFTYDSVHRGMLQRVTTVPARVILDPQYVQAIGSITEGRVKDVRVRVGDRVSPAQVLVLIHSHEIMDARGALARARAGLVAARNERQLATDAMARATRLLDARAISQAEVARARSASSTADAMYQQAEAEVERSEALVEHLTGTGRMPSGSDPHDVLIRATIAGVVVGREVQPGQVVLPGTPLLTVGNPSRLLLQMRVPERSAHDVRTGMFVRFIASGMRDTVRATVVRVAPIVDTASRTVEVLARPNSVSSLLAESFGQSELEASSGVETLLAPLAAVQVIESDTVMFVTEQRGQALVIRAAPVRLGRRLGAVVEVLDGATAGQKVIVGGASIARAELLKRRGVGGEE